MNKVKKLILIICMLLIFIFIVMVVLLSKQNIKKDLIEDKTINIEENSINISKENLIWKDVNDYETYYLLKDILNRYTVYIQELNGDQFIDSGKLNMTENEIREVLQKDALLAIKGCLDEQYMNDIKIDDKKIISEYSDYKQNGNYKENVNYNIDIENITKADIGNNITIVLVRAKMVNKEFDVIIKLDEVNLTYSLYLNDYIEKYDYSENMIKEDININSNRIEKNGYNGYSKIEVTESYIVEQYFSDFKSKMLNNINVAYMKLESEYAQSRFGGLQNFENYVYNNNDRIQFSDITKYQVLEHEGIKEYVCIDNNGKYYIFIENSVMEYSVLLDTYTVDLPEFIEKYDNGNDQLKVGMNIEKIVNSINEKDYGYFYNKLDETFRDNNFVDLVTFSEYIKNNFFENNKVNYKEFKDNNGIYTYTIEINDGNESVNCKTITIIMKLLEDRNFVMSFEIE